MRRRRQPSLAWKVASVAACGLLVIVIGLNFLAAYGPPILRPMITCDEAEWEAGNVRSLREVIHTFTIKNSGWRQLTVNRIVSDCRCVDISDSRTPAFIPASGAFTVSARVNLKGMSGEFRKRLIVLSNDPWRPKMTLVIRGRIESPKSPTIIEEENEARH